MDIQKTFMRFLAIFLEALIATALSVGGFGVQLAYGARGEPVVVGLGTGGGGWLEVVDGDSPHIHLQWIRLDWDAYNVEATGETRPVQCDLDGDGKRELVIGLGRFPGQGGWLEIRANADVGYSHLAWIHVPWPTYNALNGETFPACGDLDGDGRGEIAVGLGVGGGGWVYVFDDFATGFAPLAGAPSSPGWVRLNWPAYNDDPATGGEVHPAVGNLDGDSRAELVLGLALGGSGWVQVLDDAVARFAPLPGAGGGWIQVRWPEYNLANGETRPAVCDLNGDGQSEVVIGLGPYRVDGGWFQVFDARAGFRPLPGTQVPGGWGKVEWPEYNRHNGETFPACGDLDGDGRDELMLGLGHFNGEGGWLEIKHDLSQQLAHASWARAQWAAYDSTYGLTMPAGAGLGSAGPVYRLYGLDFSPYVDGQDPNKGSVVSEDQLLRRMRIVAPYTNWIRTFGSINGLQNAGRVARRLGLKTALGAWLGRDAAANEREITALIAVAKAGDADLLIVGSEVMLRRDLTEDQLIGYISRVRQAAPGIPVTTADVYREILAHPKLVAAVDQILVNYYPYWEGIKVSSAVATVASWHERVTATAGGKPVIVSETGWPSCGNQIFEAVPSPANAAQYFLNFVSWARANNIPYFYFEAFDETWKATTAPPRNEGPQGACWGVWDKDGSVKRGMLSVFDGQTVPDNWTTPIPGGPGTPAIEFTSVPPYGSIENDLLKGQVWHVRPSQYGVAVYIRVNGGWWNKPTWTVPLTTLRPDGSWTCDIVTGGIDQLATTITAYLVPSTYSPPLLSGHAALPAELDQNAVAKVTATR